MTTSTDQAINFKATLLKREEAEKLIIQEHSTLKKKIDSLWKIYKEESERVELLKEEGNKLSHQSVSVSAEINILKIKINSLQRKVVELDCELEEVKNLKCRKEILLENEKQTLELSYAEMREREAQVEAFWKREDRKERINEKKATRSQLEDKKSHLERELEELKKMIQEETNRLSREIMILKKRNAAHLKRMTCQINTLEEKIADRREYLNNLRHYS